MKKQNNEDFFIQLRNARLLFTNNKFPTPTSTEEILGQSISWNPHCKLDFSSDNPYFYCISHKNISDNFTLIRHLCRFLQPSLIPFMPFEEKLDLSNVNHKRLYKLIMVLVPNDWKQTLRTEAPKKSLLKTFCYNSKGTRNKKIFKNFLTKKFTSPSKLIVINFSIVLSL